jgi:hypothetical protein
VSEGPLTVEDVRALLAACSMRSSSGLRARALLELGERPWAEGAGGG